MPKSANQQMTVKTARRPTVLLGDDHTIVVEGLRRVLEPECEIVGAVRDGRELVAAAERLRPDIIVTDISMPLLNGIDAVRRIKKVSRDVVVVFLTMHGDVTYAANALAAGGSGFVLKSSAGDELLTAIRLALAGRKYVTPALSEAVQALPKRGSPLEHGVQALTGRQREVLQLVAEGKTFKEIASLLKVSPRTVEFHKYRIMEVLGIRTTGELARYAMKHGIVES